MPSHEAEARRLLIESVLLEQLVRYGVSQSWTGKKKTSGQRRTKLPTTSWIKPMVEKSPKRT
jgi:hypothetical protein